MDKLTPFQKCPDCGHKGGEHSDAYGASDDPKCWPLDESECNCERVCK